MPASIFASQDPTFLQIILCTATSLLLGLIVALIYMYRSVYSKNLVVTIILLPALVQAVIFLVNGQVGTGVAVMGAFSLVRFRSVPGSAREITFIFFAMAIGLATGMGYISYAAILTAFVGAAMLLLTVTGFGEKRVSKNLKITIPEDLDYTEIFDDLFQAYTSRAMLNRVKTTNLGSLYELQYTIVLKDQGKEKELIDKIRCRNGNLNIVCGKVTANQDEL